MTFLTGLLYINVERIENSQDINLFCSPLAIRYKKCGYFPCNLMIV